MAAVNPAELYASRAGLEPDAPSFVGRESTIRDVMRRLNSIGNMASVAIAGPRRIGKTSLLKQLLSGKCRAEYGPESEQWAVVYLDLSTRRWKGFDAFRANVLGQVADVLGQSVEDTRDECLEDVVRRLLRHAGRSCVLVLDEFDSIAADLRRDDQAELRGAIANVPQFAIVIGIARPIDTILEYIGDSVSDLSPVISIALPVLGALSADEARELVRVGRLSVGRDPDAEAENLILDMAGTHPLLLQAACYAWYSLVASRSYSDLPSAELKGVTERIADEVRRQSPFVYHSLSEVSRMLVDGRSEELSSAEQGRALRELELNGLTVQAANGLFSGSARVSAERDVERDSVEELIEAVHDLNRRHQRAAADPKPLIRADVFSTGDVILLRRIPHSEHEFKQFVEVLAKLLYDGTNGVVAPELRGKLKPTLPKCCYKDSRSVVVHLVCLRNYYVHLPAAEPDLAEKHLKDARSVLNCYAGTALPGPKEFEAARVRLLEGARLLVSRLNAHLPLDADQDADVLFSGCPEIV